MAVFTTTVTTVTREKIVPKVFDSVLNGNVGLLRLMGNAASWTSGFRLDSILKYLKSTAGGLVGVGGTLDTTRDNTRTKMQFDPKRRHKPVVIDDIEQELNEGDERVLGLLATEMDSISQDLADDFGTDLMTGTGAGNAFDSLLNASDDSTNFATYGSLARSTFGHNGFLATSVGTLALSDLSTMHNAIKIGTEKPTVLLADVTSWTAYEGLLQPTVQANYQANGFPQVTRTGTVPSQRALQGDIGFDAIWYRGTPMVEDEKVTSGYIFGLNEKFFKFHGVTIKKYEQFQIKAGNVEGPQAVPIPRGFNWSGLMQSTTQPAGVGHFYTIGDFISHDPRRNGNLQGITG